MLILIFMDIHIVEIQHLKIVLMLQLSGALLYHQLGLDDCWKIICKKKGNLFYKFPFFDYPKSNSLSSLLTNKILADSYIL